MAKVTNIPLFKNPDFVKKAVEQQNNSGTQVQVPLVAGSDEHDAQLASDANIEAVLDHDLEQADNATATRYLGNLFLTQQEIAKHDANSNGDLKTLIEGTWGARVLLPLSDLGEQTIDGLNGEVHEAVVKGPNKEFVQERLIEEGFEGTDDYVSQVHRVYDFIKDKSEGLRLSDNPEKRADVIEALYNEISSDNLLKGNDGKPVNKNLMLATIFNQVVRLDQDKIAAQENASGLQIFEDLQEKLSKQGIELMGHDPSFIFARADVGATVELKELGIFIKSPGLRPAGSPNLDADPKDYSFEKTEDGKAIIHTARATMQNRLEMGIDKLEKIFGVNSGISVVNGVSIQRSKGETTLENKVKTADDLTLEDYKGLIETALICEELGLENKDWSASSFVVKENELVPVDFGAFNKINPDETTQDRLDRIKNIVGSFKELNEGVNIEGKVTQLHQIFTDPLVFSGLQSKAKKVVAKFSENEIFFQKLKSEFSYTKRLEMLTQRLHAESFKRVDLSTLHPQDVSMYQNMAQRNAKQQLEKLGLGPEANISKGS